MKENTVPPTSLYKKHKPRRSGSTIIFILFLIAFLLVIHFFNLFLQWTVIRLELAQGPVFMSPEYTMLGFSLFKRDEIAAVGYFRNSSQPTRVFGFFDFFHPAIFAVWNRDEQAFVDLGPVVVALPAGFSRITFFPAALFFLEHEKSVALKNFNASPGGSLWRGVLAKKLVASGPVARKPLPVSFVVKELEKSRYLKIPYLIYFYLPLLVIILSAIAYGRVVFTALFYYAEIFFLFNFRMIFVSVPFDWLFKLLKWEPGVGVVELAGAAMAVLFVLGAAFGLWHLKKDSQSLPGKRIILFFILLPFFLFF
ncbi:MAG: hypothetical protein NTW95_08090 [Candidatus Aminicenantes bacterium]|nr:hypothetical protein [Candidatus Aminicenantes bacterium]